VSSLVAGKCIGIFLFGIAAVKLGFPLPSGVRNKELFVVGIIGGIGFTVALFISGEAFADLALQGATKMGAILSCGAAVIALVAGKLLKIKKAI
jgi:NhaA family Na+:H+ antiporter